MSVENAEILILKKRLNTFRSKTGSLIGVPNDLVISIVHSWEKWPGRSKEFYQGIGIKKEQLAFIIKKAKKIYRDGRDKLGPFTAMEIKSSPQDNRVPIILNWDRKKTIKFFQVNQLIEFLKKAS